MPLTLPLLLPATLLPPPTLSLLALSTLLLVALALLLLLRLISRASPGSCGFSPDALANRLSTSVRETTPDRRPESVAPGMAVAVTDVWEVDG